MNPMIHEAKAMTSREKLSVILIFLSLTFKDNF